MEKNGISFENKMKKLIIILLSIILLSGCESEKEISDEVAMINNITGINEVNKLIDDGAVLIDVRTNEEFNENHIEGAINIPYDKILKDIPSSKDKSIIVYCRSGARSFAAAPTLVNNGYLNVYDLGSIENYK